MRHLDQFKPYHAPDLKITVIDATKTRRRKSPSQRTNHVIKTNTCRGAFMVVAQILGFPVLEHNT